MGELEQLKQDWNKEKPNEFKTYSEKELFAMTKKKSVSIAKWLFIIGALELLFWIGLAFGLEYFNPASPEKDIVEEYTQVFHIINYILDIWEYISNSIPFIFIGILIYLNYKIRVEEPKKLMKNILLMRKSLQYYVRFFNPIFCDFYNNSDSYGY